MSPAHRPSGLCIPYTATPFAPFPCTSVHPPVPTMSLSGLTSSVCIVSAAAASDKSLWLSCVRTWGAGTSRASSSKNRSLPRQSRSISSSLSSVSSYLMAYGSEEVPRLSGFTYIVPLMSSCSSSPPSSRLSQTLVSTLRPCVGSMDLAGRTGSLSFRATTSPRSYFCRVSSGCSACGLNTSNGSQ
eukprot:971722-Prorocentrum_minimum.AAC.1